MTQNTDVAILERMIEPEGNGLSAELARHILSLTFKPGDQEPVDVLSLKAQEGNLTDDEQEELDSYIRLADLLALLQSKARLSLKKIATLA